MRLPSHEVLGAVLAATSTAAIGVITCLSARSPASASREPRTSFSNVMHTRRRSRGRTLLVQIEAQLGWPRFAFAGHRALAAGLFAAMSALGFGCGWILARLGDGTPLPLDATRRLVMRGPSAYVRNPMAMSGLGQAVAVGLGLGSMLVLGYVALGGAMWNWVVRPAEEEDLLGHFGDEYEHYRREVRCWIPRLRPYVSVADAPAA